MNDKPCAEVLKRACVLKKAGGKKKKETAGIDPEDKAEEDRKKLEEGVLGYALVQLLYEDKPTETHTWGEVNLREGDPKHVGNIVNSFKTVGRQDWQNPITVTVDEDLVDLSTIVSTPVPYANVPVLRFKEEAMAHIVNFLNGFHRFKANQVLYDEQVELLQAAEERVAKHKEKLEKGASRRRSGQEAVVDAELERLKKEAEKIRKRKEHWMYWMGEVFSDGKCRQAATRRVKYC